MKTIKLEMRREPRLEQEKEALFYVSLSPYFFPDSLQCEYNNDTGIITIYFRYANSEPARDLPQGDFVTLSVGQKTNKLLAIKLDVQSHNVDGVRMIVTEVENAAKAIDLAQQLNPSMKDNYRVAASALRTHKQEIADLVPA